MLISPKKMNITFQMWKNTKAIVTKLLRTTILVKKAIFRQSNFWTKQFLDKAIFGQSNFWTKQFFGQIKFWIKQFLDKAIFGWNIYNPNSTKAKPNSNYNSTSLGNSQPQCKNKNNKKKLKQNNGFWPQSKLT